MRLKKLYCFSSLVLTFLISGYRSSWAFFPVVDMTNFLESTMQTAHLLKSYELLLKNTTALNPTNFKWGEIKSTIDNLLNTIDTLKYYKERLGSVNTYLKTYQDLDFYQNHPCIKGHCTETQIQSFNKERTKRSNALKITNDAALLNIETQQSALSRDAHALKALQENVQNAEGQLAAIQAASQLANAEANELIQIRGLLLAAENRAATRASVIANKEAIQEAADMAFRSGNFVKSSGKTW